MDTIKITAPSYWACYLINGDDSGMDELERAACDAWIKREGLGEPVACEDYGFCWTHGAHREFPYGADCQEYTFLV